MRDYLKGSKSRADQNVFWELQVGGSLSAAQLTAESTAARSVVVVSALSSWGFQGGLWVPAWICRIMQNCQVICGFKLNVLLYVDTGSEFEMATKQWVCKLWPKRCYRILCLRLTRGNFPLSAVRFVNLYFTKYKKILFLPDSIPWAWHLDCTAVLSAAEVLCSSYEMFK